MSCVRLHEKNPRPKMSFEPIIVVNSLAALSLLSFVNNTIVWPLCTSVYKYRFGSLAHILNKSFERSACQINVHSLPFSI